MRLYREILIIFKTKHCNQYASSMCNQICRVSRSYVFTKLKKKETENKTNQHNNNLKEHTMK